MNKKSARSKAKWPQSTILTSALSALLLLTSGCVGLRPPVDMSNVHQGRWEAKVLVKDLKNQKTFILSMKANAILNEHLRADFTSTLGGHVASIVLNGEQLRYIVPPQKKFYLGNSKPESLKAVSSIPLDPKWFYNIFFDKPLAEKAWTCTADPAGHVSQCQQAALGLRVTWSNWDGPKKTVMIEHERGSLQMNFSSFEAQLDARPDLFTLEMPEGFSKMR